MTTIDQSVSELVIVFAHAVCGSNVFLMLPILIILSRFNKCRLYTNWAHLARFCIDNHHLTGWLVIWLMGWHWGYRGRRFVQLELIIFSNDYFNHEPVTFLVKIAKKVKDSFE